MEDSNIRGARCVKQQVWTMRGVEEPQLVLNGANGMGILVCVSILPAALEEAVQRFNFRDPRGNLLRAAARRIATFEARDAEEYQYVIPDSVMAETESVVAKIIGYAVPSQTTTSSESKSGNHDFLNPANIAKKVLGHEPTPVSWTLKNSRKRYEWTKEIDSEILKLKEDGNLTLSEIAGLYGVNFRTLWSRISRKFEGVLCDE